jgi:hypothetical protein
MENKEMIAFRNTKPHKDQTILADLWSKYQNIKDVANHLHISKKLVSIKLKEFRII